MEPELTERGGPRRQRREVHMTDDEKKAWLAIRKEAGWLTVGNKTWTAWCDHGLPERAGLDNARQIICCDVQNRSSQIAPGA
jgi:hypothetical protein